jgi:hypothetical protein
MTIQEPAVYNAGVGYPVDQVIDGNLTVVDPTGTGAYGKITCQSLQVANSGAAYQFLPETYGAKGDGKAVSDVVANGTATITSATAGWSAADVGKHIMINGANGATSGPLITTIASIQSPTQVTLASAAGASATGCQAVWGTDDTAAFNAAFAAAKTYALAANYLGEVVCKDKIYIWSAAPTQQTNPTYNAQVLIPYPNLTGTGPKLLIKFTGAGANGFAQFFQSTTPNISGTCIVSMQAAPTTPDPTFGVQAVLGGPSGGGAFSGGFANTHFHVDGISIYCPIFTNLKAWHFGFLGGTSWGHFSANIFAPPISGTHPVLTDLPPLAAFQATRGVGVIFPYTGNNDDVAGIRCAVEGYETCVVIADHFTCLSLATVYADLAVLFDSTQGGSGSSHLIYIGNWSCEAYNGGFLANGGFATLNICMDTEPIGGAGDPSYDVKDQGANLFGTFRVTDNNARTNRRPVVINCANLAVVNDMMGPGPWTNAVTPNPPAVPASGTAQQNTSWRNAAVIIATGAGVTVSAINIGGTVTGQTIPASSSATVRVPAGKNITLTYAGGTPTWVWVLD